MDAVDAKVIELLDEVNGTLFTFGYPPEVYDKALEKAEKEREFWTQVTLALRDRKEEAA